MWNIDFFSACPISRCATSGKRVVAFVELDIRALLLCLHSKDQKHALNCNMAIKYSFVNKTLPKHVNDQYINLPNCATWQICGSDLTKCLSQPWTALREAILHTGKQADCTWWPEIWRDGNVRGRMTKHIYMLWAALFRIDGSAQLALYSARFFTSCVLVAT